MQYYCNIATCSQFKTLNMTIIGVACEGMGDTPPSLAETYCVPATFLER